MAEALARVEAPLRELAKAQWSGAYVNDLPDSAFLYIEPGGEKDDGGRTVPRSLRHFPVRNHRGEPDVPHLRNALARIPQSEAPGLTAARRRELQDEARRLLEKAASDLEKARVIPFQQCGGSAKYARRLAERLFGATWRRPSSRPRARASSAAPGSSPCGSWTTICGSRSRAAS